MIGTADTGGNIFLDLVDFRVFQDATCRDDCTFCGDGNVDLGEECDPADPAGPDCNDDCTLACPDLVIDKLRPLLSHRKEQASRRKKEYYRELDYLPGESKDRGPGRRVD